MEINRLEKLHSTIERLKQDKFLYPRFFIDDSFTSWLLLDYTKFAVSRIRDLELSKLKITSEKSAVLQFLIRYGGKTSISEMSHNLMRRKHSVSTLVRRMEKQGMVSVLKYPGRRELEIVISEKGKEVVSKISRDSITEIFSVLSSEERDQLSFYLLLLLDKSRHLLRDILPSNMQDDIIL